MPFKKKNQIKASLFFCLLSFVFFGCSHFQKKDKLISIQKQRIESLEDQLEKKTMELEQMKSSRLIKDSFLETEKKDIERLFKLVKTKSWIKALAKSRKLKTKYPQSIRLSALRYRILKRLGLKKQAFKEKKFFKKLRAKAKKETSRKRF